MSAGNGVDNGIDLGPCCSCERPDGVRNVVLLEMQSPTPGSGWYCAECGLPPNGAVAVVCDECFAARRNLKWVCTGFPGTDGRTAWFAFQHVPFHHDASRHEIPHGQIAPANAPRVLILADAYYAAIDHATRQFASATEPVTPAEVSAALGAVLSRIANTMSLDEKAEWVAIWIKTIREAAGIHLQ